MQITDLEHQLQGFPLDEPVNLDGESVYLRVDQDGAELGAHFLAAITERQLADALQVGFQSALEFDAGWALSDDGSALLLTQWLPDVRGWAEVPDALEQLLNQVELLRTLVTITTSGPDHATGREERLIRSMLMREDR